MSSVIILLLVLFGGLVLLALSVVALASIYALLSM